MALFIAFFLVLSTATVRLLAFETQYKCATTLNFSDIPEDPFYLRLSDATESVSLSSSNSTCPVDDQRVNDLNCMCGENLRIQQDAIQKRLNSTCEFYDEHTHRQSSPLGFCERSLTQLGKCVNFESCPDNNFTTKYNNASLEAKITEIDKILSNYFSVLDRTLVGVYLRTKGHRCQCLEFYKRWLCATKLIFYNATSTSMGAGVGPARLRPCISVCEDVLQSCPYYLPSRFQSMNSTSQNESSSIPQSVVYGGYPAFDCPRPNICGSDSQNDSQKERCAYSFQHECFGPRGSRGSILTTSFTLIILQSLFISFNNIFL